MAPVEPHALVILERVYALMQGGLSQFVTLDARAREEIRRFAALTPVLGTNLTAPWYRDAFVGDSAGHGDTLMASRVTPD